MDGPRPRDKRPRSPSTANLLWSTEIKRDIDTWRRTEQFPFPEMPLQQSLPVANYSITDLRLIHHVSSISHDLQARGVSQFVIWTDKIPTFLRVATSYPFVMHALLGFSATHLAWLTDCQATSSIAYHHRDIALKGLQDGISSFRRDNSDAVLAASILLSWQAVEWCGWASLMQGTSTVIDAMQSWRHESHFADFMDEQQTFPRASPSPLPLDPQQIREPRREDLRALQHVYRALQNVESYVAGKDEETRRTKELMSFIRSLRSFLPVPTPAQQFDLLHPLRSWLFWLPVSFLQRVERDASMLVVLAHFYAAALAMGPVFPDIGAAYFGSMSISPIEEIMNSLSRMQDGPTSTTTAAADEEVQMSLQLMQFPLEMVADFRARMGWGHHSPLPYPQIHLIQSPYSYGSVELHTETDPSEYPIDLGMPYTPTRELSHVPSSPSIAGAESFIRPRPSPLMVPPTSHMGHYSPRSYPSFPMAGSLPAYTTDDEGSLAYSPTVSDFSVGYVPPSLWA